MELQAAHNPSRVKSTSANINIIIVGKMSKRSEKRDYQQRFSLQHEGTQMELYHGLACVASSNTAPSGGLLRGF